MGNRFRTLTPAATAFGVAMGALGAWSCSQGSPSLVDGAQTGPHDIGIVTDAGTTTRSDTSTRRPDSAARESGASDAPSSDSEAGNTDAGFACALSMPVTGDLNETLVADTCSSSTTQFQFFDTSVSPALEVTLVFQNALYQGSIGVQNTTLEIKVSPDAGGEPYQTTLNGCSVTVTQPTLSPAGGVYEVSGSSASGMCSPARTVGVDASAGLTIGSFTFTTTLAL